jgi:tRNA (cmo5U34)-methyltransferase
MPQGSDSKRDDLFARPLGRVGDFAFDEAVVNVFPDMIKRSVPGYETIIAMTGTLADRYVQADTCCYDLGCSLGASSLAIARNTHDRSRKIIGVDNSADMIGQCRKLLQNQGLDTSVELLCDDIRNAQISNASMVVLNFTLQFVPLDQRQPLLATIWNGLNPGGILVLSEKIAFANKHHNELMIELHHSFKRANGYSDLEISQKRSALENVLMPETLETHRLRLAAVGFSSVDLWFQCFNFGSMIAIKE